MNPTERIVIDLPGYIELRSRKRTEHLVDGTPDYSFSLDNQLRRRLSSIPPLRLLARFLSRSAEPLMQQFNMMRMVAVGPAQLPEVFEMGQACAATLGIGVPRIFVEPSDTVNAYTYATDDIKPSIVITSRLLRALEPDELMAVIGHECGHIHNLHMAYNTIVVLMANSGAKLLLVGAAARGVSLPLLRQLATFSRLGIGLAMQRWSRCAEVTSDRAGAICAGSTDAMIRALLKIATAGEIDLKHLDVDAYLRQLESVKSTLVRLSELESSHPIIPKRIQALRYFARSEPFLRWRPELRGAEPTLTHELLDRACEPLISVLSADGAKR